MFAAQHDPGFICLAKRKKTGEDASNVAISSLSVLAGLIALRVVWALRKRFALEKYAGKFRVCRCALQLTSICLLIGFGSATLDTQRNYEPKTEIGQSDLLSGTATAAVVVAILCAVVLFVSCCCCNMPGPDNNDETGDTISVWVALALAVMAAIAVAVAQTEDNWTWEGNRLITKTVNLWTDCESYKEGSCMTMDQWDAADRLIARNADFWEDCEAYEEGICMTMNQWYAGGSLVAKTLRNLDSWRDCDAYEEGICMTMDQWDAERC
jgi:hypothetical protein